MFDMFTPGDYIKMLSLACLYIILCTRGKLSREKAFMNFAVLWILAKVFSVKFGSVASLGMAKVSNLQKFSPLKVSHYT